MRKRIYSVSICKNCKKPFSLFPELRFDINNGITYCKEFHLNSGLHRNIKRLKQEVRIFQ